MESAVPSGHPEQRGDAVPPVPYEMDELRVGEQPQDLPSAAQESASQESASPEPSGQSSDDRPVPGPSQSASAGKSPRSKPASARKSLQSVNYPDRYWHVSDGFVRLDPVSAGSSATTRQEAGFTVVKGLANSSCCSFTTADGAYLRHRNFSLRADRDDGSDLFEKDATFCPRASSYTGAIMLESVNYPGRYLRHRNFRLHLDPYDNSKLYRADSAFRVVKGWG
ncbi:AbfB domain-containing protein [Streptomyces sp. NPDC050564]|uniref:AbfB domain-containing protein n=1 Tax=Streptomyces sp. NPDC050564 TaxID=3365631 RepID=UPI0037A9CE77